MPGLRPLGAADAPPTTISPKLLPQRASQASPGAVRTGLGGRGGAGRGGVDTKARAWLTSSTRDGSALPPGTTD